MTSGPKSPNRLQGEAYEETLGYLKYDSSSDKLSIPIQVRERHLTPDTDAVFLQAIGMELQITIFSERDSIIIRIPLKQWRTSSAYEGTLTGSNGGLLTVGRFEDYIDVVEVPDDGYGTTAQIRKIEGIGEP